MNKSFNTMRGGYEAALANLRRHGIRLYGTFIFGYDDDTPDSFAATVDFAEAHGFYIAAFNHLTPFPGHAAVRAARSARAGCSTSAGGSTIATATTWCRSSRRR